MRWEKYRISASFKIFDPETNAPAIKNPFLHPEPGVFLVDDLGLDPAPCEGRGLWRMQYGVADPE